MNRFNDIDFLASGWVTPENTFIVVFIM